MRRPSAQAGFTIAETLVAMTILLVGLAGGLRLVDVAQSTTTSSRAREQATALAREVVETARSVRFDTLNATSAAGLVQAGDSDLRDASPAAGWTVRRRGTTFTVAVGACTVDDPGDGLGARDPASHCTTGAGTANATTCRQALGSSGDISGTGAVGGSAAGDCGLDLNKDGTVDGLVGGCTVNCAATAPPDANTVDYKRVVVLVRWDRGTGLRWVLQGATVPSPRATNTPTTTTLVADGLTPSPSDGAVHITTAGVESVGLTATTSSVPAGMRWAVDGVPLDTATGSGTTWRATWGLGAQGASAPAAGQVLDGLRTVTAAAVDSTGVRGQERALTFVLDRRRPYPPLGFTAMRTTAGVLTEWLASPEGDVTAYRVLRRPASGGAETTVCAQVTTTSCLDGSAPLADLRYRVVALDAAGTGDSSEVRTVRATNTAPPSPTGLVASAAGSGTRLDWVLPGPDPDGDELAFFRIYRDGTTADDRYATTTSGTTTSWLDAATGGRQHRYWVAAVDSQGGESPKAGPVQR